MKNKAFVLIVLLLLGAVSPADAQQRPKCASGQDRSDMTEDVFEPFVMPELAQHRAAIGIATQDRSASHGVLRDNDMCVALRQAMLRLLASRGDTLAADIDMSFFRMGAYFGVFVDRPPLPGGVVVSGTIPMYVFTAASSATGRTRARTPRAAAAHPKLRFVTDLLQF